MKRIVALLATFVVAACTPLPVRPDYAGLDAEVPRLMRASHVEGLALAIVDEGRVVHVAAYGRRDVERDLPLTTDTVMYGASLTKAAFGYLVMQLVDEGRVDLDASIADLLPAPLPTYQRYADLAGDDRWRALTPRILLNHRSGFANFRWLEPDGKLRMHFDPGTRYAYSGEGIALLQFALETKLGIDVGREMQTRLFDRFGMTRTSMTWRADFADDVVVGYRLDGSVEAHSRRSRANAVGSMDTTIADQARLWAAMVRGDGLRASSRAAFVAPGFPIASAHQFPTLVPETSADNAKVGLSAALGVLAFRDASGAAWFKGGHDDSTGNMTICLEQRRRCVVLLSNDVRAERLYPGLVHMVLGATAMPWRWEYGWSDEP